MEWVSGCCTAPEQGESMDIGRCTACQENCEYIDLDYDPTPWCHTCHATHQSGCICGPIARNH